jgi:glycine/D-amino acid oxidase-like deaminating enzyme
MALLPDQEMSYWKISASAPDYPTLTENLKVDVAVVGGGITGITSAYLLTLSGMRVAVVEKNTIASGTTGGTTGKVTSQHSLIYKELVNQHGQGVARTYAEANQAAIELIESVIKKEKIDCEWEREDNYVYTSDKSQVETFMSEVKVASSLGLPASFETNVQLPFDVKAAVKFANQAKFNSVKYVHGLAEKIKSHGSYVFEKSNVIGIHDGSPAKIRTKHAEILAKHIIVASKVPASPLIARGAYCALEYPHTSYIVAGAPSVEIKGMYISPDKGHYSILPIKEGKQKLLLIGGENHIPGLGSPSKRYQKLAEYAQKYFGINEIKYSWKAMDYIAYDKLPLIGKVYPWSKHLYTATAFRKWGLSTSMVAGVILRDLITGNKNSWAEAFTPQRIKPILSIPKIIIKG